MYSDLPPTPCPSAGLSDGPPHTAVLPLPPPCFFELVFSLLALLHFIAIPDTLLLQSPGDPSALQILLPLGFCSNISLPRMHPQMGRLQFD